MGTVTSKPPPYSQARQINLDGWSQKQKKAMFKLLMREKEGKDCVAPTASGATDRTQDFRDDREGARTHQSRNRYVHMTEMSDLHRRIVAQIDTQIWHQNLVMRDHKTRHVSMTLKVQKEPLRLRDKTVGILEVPRTENNGNQ
jgi:hypothetical protein